MQQACEQSPPQEPLYTLGRALQLWPKRRRPNDTSTKPLSNPDDQGKLVHAQHLFLMHQRATEPGPTRPYAPLMLLGDIVSEPDLPA